MSVRLVLAKGREKSLLRRHPRVFSGAVARMEGKASLGETIDIVDHQGNGWRVAHTHLRPRSALASGRSIKMKPLTSTSLSAACSKLSSGVNGWQNVTVWTAIA